MESLSVMVERIRDGDADAYASIVRRFQDMAVGYGYSILRDFQMAEDAAQEAFFEAYRELAKLREPAAFPGWFRRIVFKHCDRLIRGKSLLQVPLEDAVIEDSAERSPTELIEQGEMKDRIWEAVESLPEHERTVVTLYYMSGHSQKEIGEFLDVPVGTIKKRLFSGRNRLRELLIDLVEDNLRERRPSRDETFANSIIELLKAARTGDLPRVKELLEQNPRLVGAKDPLGNTALILAVNSGHNEIAELLYNAGVRPDIYEAASIGRTDLVAEFIKDESSAIDQYSREGFTPLGLAAHFGHVETAKFLIDQGADVNVVSRHPLGVTPLHAALFGKKIDTALLLLDHGANVNAQRGGGSWPRSGWTALHYAAAFGFIDLVQRLINLGADLNIEDNEGKTPLRVAIEENQLKIAEFLRQNWGTE
ncbi:MAG TPA: sigma-70 family RNA polymerase sigma factor [Blastocatellia bacterium]|nr:sigma-70 family RNA polymerase sigma factor [Blastocatellia bacterium]